jgi:hypothetical protein
VNKSPFGRIRCAGRGPRVVTLTRRQSRSWRSLLNAERREGEDEAKEDRNWRDASQRDNGIVFHQFCSPTMKATKPGESDHPDGRKEAERISNRRKRRERRYPAPLRILCYLLLNPHPLAVSFL